MKKYANIYIIYFLGALFISGLTVSGAGAREPRSSSQSLITKEYFKANFHQYGQNQGEVLKRLGAPPVPISGNKEPNPEEKGEFFYEHFIIYRGLRFTTLSRQKNHNHKVVILEYSKRGLLRNNLVDVGDDISRLKTKLGKPARIEKGHGAGVTEYYYEPGLPQILIFDIKNGKVLRIAFCR